MIDIDSIDRSVEGNGDKTVVALTRTYDAEITDVWNAITDRDRLSRWFLPVEGDLRVGGTYQTQGNAGGTILACEPPRRLVVTWVFAPEPTEKDITELEIQLHEDGDKTVLEMRHSATQTDPEFWDRFGPGAVGVGWDLTLLGLAMYLATGSGPENPREWEMSEEARAFMTKSSEAWGVANAKFGTPPDKVAQAVANTTEFYAPTAAPAAAPAEEPAQGPTPEAEPTGE